MSTSLGTNNAWKLNVVYKSQHTQLRIPKPIARNVLWSDTETDRKIEIIYFIIIVYIYPMKVSCHE